MLGKAEESALEAFVFEQLRTRGGMRKSGIVRAAIDAGMVKPSYTGERHISRAIELLKIRGAVHFDRAQARWRVVR